MLHPFMVLVLPWWGVGVVATELVVVGYLLGRKDGFLLQVGVEVGEPEVGLDISDLMEKGADGLLLDLFFSKQDLQSMLFIYEQLTQGDSFGFHLLEELLGLGALAVFEMEFICEGKDVFGARVLVEFSRLGKAHTLA